jgi:hypothetical protein
MSPTHRPAARPRAARVAPALALIALLLAGCGIVSTTAPSPTPADFPGIAAELAKQGINVNHAVSGDAGCDDHVLAPTAISFDAVGLDQATPVRLHLYVFRNRAVFERLRGTVDSCARAFVTDPESYESVDQSPFVIASQGPWGSAFEAALRQGLETAAGTGG